MSRTRSLADLLDSGGDVLSTALDNVSGSHIKVGGETFDNPNVISANKTTTLVDTKNYMILGPTITLTSNATWTIDGTGELHIA